MDEFTEYLLKKLREQNNTLDLEAARTIERLAQKCDELEKTRRDAQSVKTGVCTDPIEEYGV